MNKAYADEMKLELLRVAAICATQRECLGCPAHGGYDNGCFFDNCKLPPERWIEKMNLRGDYNG